MLTLCAVNSALTMQLNPRSKPDGIAGPNRNPKPCSGHPHRVDPSRHKGQLQQELEEQSLAMISRLQREKQALGKENEGLRKEVAALKAQVGNGSWRVFEC